MALFLASALRKTEGWCHRRGVRFSARLYSDLCFVYTYTCKYAWRNVCVGASCMFFPERFALPPSIYIACEFRCGKDEQVCHRKEERLFSYASSNFAILG